MQRDELIYFATRIILNLGLLALGFAAGLQFAFTEVQATVMTVHHIPLKQQAGDLYPVLLLFRDLINAVGGLAAAALITGGLLERREMLTEWYAEVTSS